MATVTGLTAERMFAIESASVVDGEVVSGNLILTTFGGTAIDAGPVVGPTGPQGPIGPMGGFIPGEVRLWPGGTLPAQATYGKWVWADGGVYVTATYPVAAGNIATQWRTFAGASDPGASNFRVPDLRGLVPAGLDAMPGGARANRMTRAVAITIAARTGEETHVITVGEMANHSHAVNDPGHYHTYNAEAGGGWTRAQGGQGYNENSGNPTSTAYTGISLQNTGGNGAHENVQPTVFVPYIVFLGG